jgi:hypothetical protein
METTTNYNENNAYYRERVEESKGFYGNLISHCIVIFDFINLVFSTLSMVLVSAGVGVLTGNACSKVFGYSSNWEERKFKRF